jgi:transposase
MEIQLWSSGSNPCFVRFCSIQKKGGFSHIHENFVGIDLTYLVGEPIEPVTLNDDLFGQLLDRMHEYSCSTLYHSIPLNVRITFSLPPNYFLHSDITSHVLTEEYECVPPEPTTAIIKPKYGISKENRLDLKQIMSGAITNGDVSHSFVIYLMAILLIVNIIIS